MVFIFDMDMDTDTPCCDRHLSLRLGMKSSAQGEVHPYQHLSNSSTTPIPSVQNSPQSRQINAPPTSDKTKAGNDDDTPMTLATSAAMVQIHLPVFINWLGIVGLIFGGCCSNVNYNHRQLFSRFDLM